MKNIVYFYENRIPINIRKLVIKLLKEEKFKVKSLHYKLSDKKIKKELNWSDAVLFAPGRYLSDEIINSVKNVKLFQIWSSGFEKFNINACKKNNIKVCNNGSQNNVAVAEHAVLLILGLYKKIIHFHQRAKTGKWAGNSHGYDLYELKGKEVGLIGLGRIGKEVTRILNGFGCKISYYDIKRHEKKTEKKLNIKFKSKNHLLKTSDIISLHLHLNSETRHYLNSKSFSRIKKNAILINVSRADLIERNSLVKALKTKKIAGLGIDAHYQEPTRPKDKLLLLDNVLSTPHTAGSTYDTYIRVIKACIGNIKRGLKNKKLKWRVC